MKLKIGDRVRVIDKFSDFDMKGELGTVIEISSESSVGVDFDEKFSRQHNLNGNSKNGHGRYGSENELELVKGKSAKPVPVELHVVLQDNCNNFLGVMDSYKEAEEYASKNCSNDVTVYKLVKIAQVKSMRKVIKKRK